MSNFISLIEKVNLFNCTAIVFLILLIVSVIIDRRRFRNAVYLQMFLITVSMGMLALFYGQPAYRYIYFFVILVACFLLFVVPVLLLINGFVVIHREGFSLSNLVSSLFGILIILGEAASIYSLSGVDPLENKLRFALIVAFGTFVFYTSMVFLAFMFYSFFIQIIPRKIKFNYVVVLGAGLLDGERVTKLLAERIDKGIAVYRHSLKKGCRMIMSGGQGGDEKISEAQAMKNYAVSHGVPEKDILLEDRSINTMENLSNSKQIIDAQPGPHAAAVVTSQYHVLRADVYARALNFAMSGIGAGTALYYWPTAMTREYAGLVRHYWKTYVFFYLVFIIPLIITLYQ